MAFLEITILQPFCTRVCAKFYALSTIEANIHLHKDLPKTEQVDFFVFSNKNKILSDKKRLNIKQNFENAS